MISLIVFFTDDLKIKKKRNDMTPTSNWTTRNSTESGESKNVNQSSRGFSKKSASSKSESTTNTKTIGSKNRRCAKRLEMKKRVVQLAQAHPNWSLAKIQKHSGCTRLLQRKTIEGWVDDIKRGGSRQDKIQSINEWVYKKYMERTKQKQNELVDYETFTKWGYLAKKELFPLDDFEFKTSNTWIIHFKKLYGIQCLRPSKKKILSREEKEKIVRLFDENPTWSLQRLREESGYHQVTDKRMISRYRLAIQNDKTSVIDKINNWVFQECCKCKEKREEISDEFLTNLREKANEKFNNIKMDSYAGKVWLSDFKKKFNITGNSNNLVISKKNSISPETLII